MNSFDKIILEQKVIEKLKNCYDPEIPIDIYELGLIYEIKIDDNSNVYIKMTLTSPACPVAGSLPGEVKNKVKSIEGVNDVFVDIVFDPPWNKDMMSDAAKLELGFF
jgi:FeS assembly SUF system protein